MLDNLILILIALAVYFIFFRPISLLEKFSGFVQHGVTVTDPPPNLPQKPVPWLDNYARHTRAIHDIHHAPVLINYFPMLKPPSLIEETNAEDKVDVARSQFIPRMAKRTGVV